MPRPKVIVRWSAVVGSLALAQLMFAQGQAASPVTADCATPCPPPPCALPCPAPCPTPACAVSPPTFTRVPAPRVIVHVPPPEVVYEDSDCQKCNSHSKGSLFRKFCNPCDHCARSGNQQVQTQTILTPLSASVTTFGSLGQFGTVAAPAQERVQMVRQVETPVERVLVREVAREETCRSNADSLSMKAFEAEMRVSSIIAARAQQDAELRHTLSTLDRARSSVSAALSFEGKTSSSVKGLAEATAETTLKISQQLDGIERRLSTLESDVKGLKDQQSSAPMGKAPNFVPAGGISKN